VGKVLYRGLIYFRVCSFSFAVLFFLSLLTLEAFADEPKKEISKSQKSRKLDTKLAISADYIEQHKKEGTATAKGHVVILYKDSIILGENCQIDNNAGKGIMEMDTKLLLKDLHLEADRMEFDLDMGFEKGYNVKGYSLGGGGGGGVDTSNGYSFSADKVIKISPAEYYFEGGSFSSCDPEDQDWHVSSSSTNYYLEDYAIFKNATIFFKRVPIFYTPIWGMPTVTKRKTGFLFPSFGTTSRDAEYFNTTYFINLSESDDITLYLDFIRRRGYREGFEYRYAYSEDTHGEFSFDYINDKRRKEGLWSLKYNNRHKFDNGIDNRVQIEEESPISYSKEFTGNLNFNTRRFTDSYVEFSKIFSNKQVSFLNRQFRDLGVVKDQTINSYSKLPGLSANLLGQGLFGSRLVGGVQSDFAEFVQKNESTASGFKPSSLTIDRYHIRPSLSLPLVPYKGLNVTPWIEGRSTWYSKRSLTDEKSLQTDFYTAGLNMQPPKLFKVYHVGGRAFKHIISPRISYRYIPGYEVDGKDRKAVPVLDNLDSGSPANMLSFSLNNSLLVKSGQTSLGGEILKLVLTQNYNINEANRVLDPNNPEDKNRPFSNLSIDLDSKFFDWFLLNQFISYNYYTNRPDSAITEFAVNFDNGIYSSYNYNFTRNKSGAGSHSFFHSGVIGWKVAKGLSLETSAIYNEVKAEFPATMYRIDYKSCCYSLSFSATSMTKFKTDDSTGKQASYWDTNYLFLFTFSGFGGFGAEPARLVAHKL